jgi:Xaa-Pro aminopeptidase
VTSQKKSSDFRHLLSFSADEFARRHNKIREIMQSRGIDSLIITGNTGLNQSNASDLRYITGLPAADGTYILFPLGGEPVYLVPSPFVADRVEKLCSIPVSPVDFKRGTRIRDYGSDLVARIKALGLENGTIGIVTTRVMPADVYIILKESLPKADFIPAGDVLLECRLIKSPAELDFVRKAGECADKGFEALIEAVQPGVTEAELTACCDYAMIRAGADRGPFILLASGPWEKFGGAIGDASYSQRQLQIGDIILTEFSPSYRGYYAQLCVPVSVGGSLPRSLAELLEIDKEIYHLALKELQPGNATASIENKILDFARKRGNFRRAWALQSTELAEAFYKVDTTLKAGMSYVIHPWTEYSSGKGLQGHTIGNTVIVGAAGTEQINRSPLDLVTVQC